MVPKCGRHDRQSLGLAVDLHHHERGVHAVLAAPVRVDEEMRSGGEEHLHHARALHAIGIVRHFDQEFGQGSLLSCGAHARGRITRNSVWPGLESTSISPWCSVTRRRAMSRPSPVPPPTGLVVKNGSKIRSCIWLGMPGPLSTTFTTTELLGVPALTSTRPASGTASMALSIRFAQTWLSSPPKPSTGGRSLGTSMETTTDLARAFAPSTAIVSARPFPIATGWGTCD